MDSDSLNYIDGYFAQTLAVTQAANDDPQFKATVKRIAEAIIACFRAGGKAMFAGNGGSAGDAQHIAGEFISRLNFNRAPLAGLALTTDTSILTSIGNDYGFEDTFSRQIIGLGRRGDVFLAITTSGKSPNILKAVKAAREMGILTVGFTGKTGGALAGACDMCLHVPSDVTPLIQQVHIIAAHLICAIVEQTLFPQEHLASLQPKP